MKEIEILFCGDFLPCGPYEKLVLKKKENIFGDALPLIKSSDLSFVNLETPLTLFNSSIYKSGPSLKSHPAIAEVLKDFSVVGLANNHILDYGKKGLQDTLDVFKKLGISTVGAGMELKKNNLIYIKEIEGVKIGILALAEQHFNYSKDGNFGSILMDPIDNYNQIQDARSKSDFLIVTIHGGIQNFPYPSPAIRKLSKYYIDIGVNAVICHHPHVPGAYEYYKNKLIIYSLGDFIHHHENPNKTNNFGYIAKINICKEKKNLISFNPIPYKQSLKLDGIKLLKNDEKEEFLSLLQSYKMTMENEKLWEKEWDTIVNDREQSFILRMFFPQTFKGLGLITKFTPLLKMLLIKRSIPKKLNIIRSNSYREILIKILEDKIKR